ncbi:putative glycoside hydrolase [Gorillibacterium sp. sgz5001074]|uniref:putative glycoside hydrolase n=1 Tax=Gorillibacterium sp. sgz5001074 TaxID=3446695 RepID=UPI003F66257D
MSAWNMSGAKYDKLVKLVEETDLNAMVLDVKNDSGQVTYPSNVPLVNEIQADGKEIVPDMAEKVKQLKAKGIYTIGRVVIFKDPFLASKKTSYAMQKKGGGIWRDGKGVSWVDPYDDQVWNYNIAIAKEAAALGFDEIQFDYVRFPDNAKKVDEQVQYRNPEGSNKSEAIVDFLTRARDQLPNVVLSADVFGLTTSSKDDMGIGQKWEAIAPVVDVICPMIYPSHYSKGMYNITNPDLKPYDVVAKALSDAAEASKKTAASHKTARIRPWLQDFTAKWVKPHQTYGNKQVQEQIQAGLDQGIDEFLLWNPSGQYSFK